ncbi:SRPBCC family protein [Streptomyces sp. KMM 9044]|uniref:SRPBCC family protein n=1 Tax=Streptomyces sp. KMM 9044 TaxID=2744474 RepID=UPI0021516916|nr:SRPBCC family protein [Streptomyces sp. KMM 9044]WAX76950.1 SRPBCC family protein [Streptomyces sp. KMM 9044]
MVERHRLIERPPADVWAVLADGTRYADWVVGTSGTRPDAGVRPHAGSSIVYTVHLAPWSVAGSTVVRRCEAPFILEREADSGWLGTARTALEVRPWGENTLVTINEHPLRGPGGVLHNTVVDAPIQPRHRTMLARLADAVEHSPRKPPP